MLAVRICAMIVIYGFVAGRPCKIVEMSTSKTGKHGHAKVHLVALDIFTGMVSDSIQWILLKLVTGETLFFWQI